MAGGHHYDLARGKFVVDALTRKWLRDRHLQVEARWVHDSEHDLHYAVYWHSDRQLACLTFLGDHLKAVRASHQQVEALKQKVRANVEAIGSAVAGASPDALPADLSEYYSVR